MGDWQQQVSLWQEIDVQHGLDYLQISETTETKTSSRLRAWYLVRFRGYTVTQRKEIPKVTRLGRLTYECQWYLRAEIGPDRLS